MIIFIQPVLYTDPQAVPPVCFCRLCGGECYSDTELCPDCEEDP